MWCILEYEGQSENGIAYVDKQTTADAQCRGPALGLSALQGVFNNHKKIGAWDHAYQKAEPEDFEHAN